jgi:hypothetical protein
MQELEQMRKLVAEKEKKHKVIVSPGHEPKKKVR